MEYMRPIGPVAFIGPVGPVASVALALVLSSGCVSATSYERGAFARLHDGFGARALEYTDNPPGDVVLDGTLDAYVAYAMAHHPGLEAAFEEWRAAVYAIAEQRLLPEPVISYGLFLRRVETRVGPQRHRFGLRQMIPWPSERRAKANAASARADAAEYRFQVQALAIRAYVADAYWRVWQVREVRHVEQAQRTLLFELATFTRARIAIGKASLADLSQMDLSVSRRDDVLASLDEQEEQALAGLRQAIGAPMGLALPVPAITQTPDVGLPRESLEALVADARAHPRLEQISSMARASDDQAQVARTRTLPDMTLSLEYIETGPALMPDAPDSGKDPIVFMVSMSVPLWRDTYSDAERAANAQAAALRARRHEAEDVSQRDVRVMVSRVRESTRRVALYRHTLIPQSETTYQAVVGGYQTGATALANVLLAQKSVLELHIQLIGERAEHARAWARLEDMVGRPVARVSADDPARAGGNND